MTPDHRTKVLNLIQKLEFNGQWEMASILRTILMLAESVPELEQRLADARGGPGGVTE